MGGLQNPTGITLKSLQETYWVTNFSIGTDNDTFKIYHVMVNYLYRFVVNNNKLPDSIKDL